MYLRDTPSADSGQALRLLAKGLRSSALLALLNDEPGGELVRGSAPDSAISAVNLSEVVAKLANESIPEEDIRDALDTLPLDVVPFDSEQAYQTGLLRPLTRPAGLSLGDRACLSLARGLDLPALTADRRWEQLSVGAQVRVIR